MMRTAVLLSVFLSGILGFAAACNRQPPAPPAPPPPPFKATVPMLEFMEHVMMPAADNVWKHFGTIITAKSEEVRYPSTDADWEEVESGVIEMMEATNALMIPGRAKDNDGWMKEAVGFRDFTENMLKVVQAKDKEGIETAIDELDEKCDSCHMKYDPSFSTPPPAK